MESSHINQDLIKKLLNKVDMPSIDIFLVGLQDVVKSGGFKIFGSDAKDYAAKYEQEFLRYFKSMDITLKKYASHNSGERILLVFVKETCFQFMGRDNSDNIKYGGGVMGALGGKTYGAIVQRMTFNDTTITAVNAHLSSGNDEIQQRASEVKKIFNESFQKDKFGQVQEEMIENSDIVFFFGNLNFRLALPDSSARITCDGMDTRVDSDWTDDEIRKIKTLAESDEFVTNHSDEGSCFAAYAEGPISFGPTYKFDPKTKRFSIDSGFTCAWTDRIVYKGEDAFIKCIQYESITSVRESTHIPVVGVFNFETKEIDKEKRDVCIERLISKMKQGESLDQQTFSSPGMLSNTQSGGLKPDQEIKKIFQDANLLG